jgi:hypothetical protein
MYKFLLYDFNHFKPFSGSKIQKIKTGQAIFVYLAGNCVIMSREKFLLQKLYARQPHEFCCPAENLLPFYRQ